ncbi:MAG: hypothetical protein WBD71_09155, partial [Xanthobacteraceae bacterium]
PWGLRGGTAGETGGYLLRLPDESDFRQLAGARLPVPLGAAAIVRTGGGGGWGDPCDRDPAKVIDDVREEFISRDSARKFYGVVMSDDFELDHAATDVLRGEMRQKTGRNGSAGG